MAYAPKVYRRGDAVSAADLLAAGALPAEVAGLGLAEGEQATVRSAHNAAGRFRAGIIAVTIGQRTRVLTIDLLPLVHLQGVGDVEGRPAGDLKPGDAIGWNYGYVTDVVQVREVSAQYVEVTQSGRGEYAGSVTTRRLKRTRLVAKAE